jgi:hypothetical protein
MQLNLPEYNIKLQRDNELIKIYDRLRKKYVALTPEEWVRQHFIEYLINDKHYPEGLMANEVGLTLNGTARRCDSIVANKSGAPIVIIEYKAPTVSITQAVFDQIVRYNMVLQARYLMVSNGMVHYCCAIDYESHSYKFLKEIPDYSEIIQS